MFDLDDYIDGACRCRWLPAPFRVVVLSSHSWPPEPSLGRCAELSDITREVILPGPVRLPDIIDMYQDVWSPITEDSDSDPDW